MSAGIFVALKERVKGGGQECPPHIVPKSGGANLRAATF
jgi:hypothetical protein